MTVLRSIGVLITSGYVVSPSACQSRGKRKGPESACDTRLLTIGVMLEMRAGPQQRMKVSWRPSSQLRAQWAAWLGLVLRVRVRVGCRVRVRVSGQWSGLVGDLNVCPLALTY